MTTCRSTRSPTSRAPTTSESRAVTGDAGARSNPRPSASRGRASTPRRAHFPLAPPCPLAYIAPHAGGSARDLRWGHSSVGRALEWHSRGQGFDPPWLHQSNQAKASSYSKPEGLCRFPTAGETALPGSSASGESRFAAPGFDQRPQAVTLRWWVEAVTGRNARRARRPTDRHQDRLGVSGTGVGRPASSIATKVNTASVTFSLAPTRPRSTQASTPIPIELRPTRSTCA